MALATALCRDFRRHEQPRRMPQRNAESFHPRSRELIDVLCAQRAAVNNCRPSVAQLLGQAAQRIRAVKLQTLEDA
jgi:hypothetical protein